MYSYQLATLPPARGPLHRISAWLGAGPRNYREASWSADRIRLRRRSIPAGCHIPLLSDEDLLVVSGDVKLLRDGRIVGMRYAGDTIGTSEAAAPTTLVAHTEVCIMQLPRH